MIELRPELITLAREAAGLTQLALAQRLKVSQAYLSQVEHGFKHPTDQFMLHVASELERPVEFFSLPNRILGDGIVDFFHRKRATLPAKPLRRAHATANVIKLELDGLLRGVDLTNEIELPSIPMDVHRSPVEAARLMRAHWRAAPGPLLHLTAQIERMGVVVMTVDLGHPKLSAMSLPLDAGNHLMVVNDQLPATHQRFAVAHELGHLVQHRSLTELGSAGELESEADAFAAELLAPHDQIGPELAQLSFRDLGALKQRWHLSMSAIVYRAKALGRITPDEATSLYKRLSSMPGGRYCEPGEPRAEEPRLAKHVIGFLRDQLGYTNRQIAMVMNTTEARLRTVYLGEAVPRLHVVRQSNGPAIPVPPLPKGS